MLIRLLLAFILIPFVELTLLLQLADETSWLATLAIVIGTGILGSVLARNEGIGALGRFREAMAAGRMPGREIQDGMMIAFAAALLLTPGLLTDTFGFFLLAPWGRRVVGNWIRRRFSRRFQVHTSGFESAHARSSRRESQPDGASRWGHRTGESTNGYTVDSPSFGPKQRSAQ